MSKMFPFKYNSIEQQLTVSLYVVITLLLLMTTLTFYIMERDSLREQLDERLLDLTRTAALMVDGNKNLEIRTVEAEKKQDYRELKAMLKNFSITRRELRFIYMLTRTEKPNILHFVVGAQENPEMAHHSGDQYDISRLPEMQKAFATATTDKKITRDPRGSFLSGYAPIKDKTGESVALIWIGISADKIIHEKNKLKIVTLVIIVLSALLSWYLCRIIAGDFYKPIQSLIIGTRRIAENDFTYKMQIENHDEFGKLAESFNYMARKLREYEAKLAEEVRSEKKQKKQIFKVYKDVMYAVSQGKFVLIDEKELTEYMGKGTIVAEQDIDKPEDVGTCRRLVEQVLTIYSVEPKAIRQTMLAVSEAATNVVKHAKNGKLTILLCGGLLKLVISDWGPGMSFDKIPYMVFFNGFSTKISLGFGFSLMYQCTDKLSLQTGKSGTTVIMEKRIA